MIRNLRAFGLVLVTVIALGAMSASAASAANGRLTSTGPVTLEGVEFLSIFNSYTMFGGAVECPGSTITGHKYNVTPHAFIPSGAETATLTPDYNQIACQSAEGGTMHKATVTMNECDYVLHIGETDGAADSYNTTLDIVCPAGKSIVVDVYFASSNENLKVCELTVGPQIGLFGATLTDRTNGELDLDGTYTHIHASRSGVCGAKETNEGAMDAYLLIDGRNESGGRTSIGLSHL